MTSRSNENGSVLLVAVGLGSLYIWLFIAFPAFSPEFSLGTDLGWNALIRVLASGLLTGILVTVFSKALTARETRAWVMGAAVLFRIVGQLVASFMDAPGAQPEMAVLSYTLLGGGLGISLVFWGVLLCAHDVEENEGTFVVSFALAGSVLLLASVIPDVLTPALSYALPVIELVLYVRCDTASTDSTAVDSRDVVSPANPAGHSMAPLLVRTIIAISLVSATWDVITDNTASSGVPQAVAFAIGMLFAAAGLWLFTKYSASVGFRASVRWVIPLLAIGMALGVFETAPLAFCACLVTAFAHTFFETILRLQVIRFAQANGSDAMRTVGMGFSAIMFGSALGSIVYRLVSLGFAGHYTELVVCMLTATVVAVAFAFPSSSEELPVDFPDVSGSEEPHPTPSAAQMVGERYGLSAREVQVLAYLLQGRSRSYVRDELHISISTVDTHIRHIYDKTGATNRQELIDMAEAAA